MDPQPQPPVTFFAMLNDPRGERFFSSVSRRIPTSGDASRAIRARPPGPSHPDDEQSPGCLTPRTFGRSARCSPTDHSRLPVGCRNSRTDGDTRGYSG